MIPAPLVTYRVRPILTFLVWVVAGVIIGIAGGFVFGLAFGVVYGAGGDTWAVGLIGIIYGLFLGAPFGVVVGLVVALLRRPRPFQQLVGTVRIIGFALLGTAGIIGGAMWAPLLFAAGFGAWLGAMATPFVVRVTTAPVDLPVEAQTVEATR